RLIGKTTFSSLPASRTLGRFLDFPSFVLSYRQRPGSTYNGEKPTMDVEKTMQFLLEQQARFDARQAEFDNRQAEFVARQGELLASQAQLLASQAQFVERQGQFEERMMRLESVLLDVATAQERTNEILVTLTERHVELAECHMALTEAQKVTQQNLNALIATLERHIANHK
ncbi:MAG TPA: hypothetical protein VK651_09095, partial [Blastocatellia bacterium]|nr:hypothetical protein [Blastocatellia bacterium]